MLDVAAPKPATNYFLTHRVNGRLAVQHEAHVVAPCPDVQGDDGVTLTRVLVDVVLHIEVTNGVRANAPARVREVRPEVPITNTQLGNVGEQRCRATVLLGQRRKPYSTKESGAQLERALGDRFVRCVDAGERIHALPLLEDVKTVVLNVLLYSTCPLLRKILAILIVGWLCLVQEGGVCRQYLLLRQLL